MKSALNDCVPPIDRIHCSNNLLCIPVMPTFKQQVNEGLALHTPMEKAGDKNARNHEKQGANALGFDYVCITSVDILIQARPVCHDVSLN